MNYYTSYSSEIYYPMEHFIWTIRHRSTTERLLKIRKDLRSAQFVSHRLEKFEALGREVRRRVFEKIQNGKEVI